MIGILLFCIFINQVHIHMNAWRMQTNNWQYTLIDNSSSLSLIWICKQVQYQQRFCTSICIFLRVTAFHSKMIMTVLYWSPIWRPNRHEFCIQWTTEKNCKVRLLRNISEPLVMSSIAFKIETCTHSSPQSRGTWAV